MTLFSLGVLEVNVILYNDQTESPSRWLKPDHVNNDGVIAILADFLDNNLVVKL